MSIPTPVREAYRETLETARADGIGPQDILDPTIGTKYVTEYLDNLKRVGSDIEPPLDPNIGDDLSFAILNQDAPIEERRMHANRAFDQAKATAFTHAPKVGNIDLEIAFERADLLSEVFVKGVTDTASSYPAKTDLSDMREAVSALVDPDSTNPEDSAVTAIATFNVMQPYIVSRVLNLDIYDQGRLSEQLAELRTDCILAYRLFNSLSGASKFAVTGKTDLTEAEMADELFDIGPIFVQLGQSFTVAAQKTGGDEESKQFVARVGKAMQEGVAMPSEEQRKKLADNLPEGLVLEGIFSSAKIAYVAKTKDSKGEYATKIKRPGVEKAISDNSRMLNLMVDVVGSYIETHAGNSALVEKLSIFKESLPFGLAVTENDMFDELDFEKEAALQRRGGAVLSAHRGILVPSIIDRYSDENHITMENIPGTRVEEMPANSAFIKNAMILFLKGRKERLFHGDMHGGNVKAADNAPEGTLVAYDWGVSVEMPKKFEADLVKFLMGVARKNPKAMAKAYRKIQDPNHYQVTQAEGEEIARQAIEAAKQNAKAAEAAGQYKNRTQRRVKEVTGVLKNFIGMLGMEYQSTLDTRYTKYMKSTVSLATIIASELAKPEYSKRRYKTTTLLKSAASAIREVYFQRNKNE